MKHSPIRGWIGSLLLVFIFGGRAALADSLFTIEDPPWDFEVIDTDPFDGIGDNGVETFCQEEGLPVLLRIPFDRRIAEAYAGGMPLIEALPDYRARFQELYNAIRGQVQQAEEA